MHFGPFSFFFFFLFSSRKTFYCLQMCLNLMPINNADVCGKNLKLQEVLFFFIHCDATIWNWKLYFTLFHVIQVETKKMEILKGFFTVCIVMNVGKCVVEIKILCFKAKSWFQFENLFLDASWWRKKIINQNNGDN